jgi:phage-related protein
MAKDLLVTTVKDMSVTDAKNILTGGDTSVTKFFADKTRDPLGVQFLPIVHQATDNVGLADKYNSVASRAAGMGLVKKEDANIQQYVTGKTLDGLYFVVGEEEKKLRQNPLGAGSDILKKVFGVLR